MARGGGRRRPHVREGDAMVVVDVPDYIRKTRICKFHIVGACSRGDSCTFAHGDDEMRLRPDFSRTKLCPSIMGGGKCPDPGCGFAHNREELRKIIKPISDILVLESQQDVSQLQGQALHDSFEVKSSAIGSPFGIHDPARVPVLRLASLCPPEQHTLTMTPSGAGWQSAPEFAAPVGDHSSFDWPMAGDLRGCLPSGLWAEFDSTPPGLSNADIDNIPLSQVVASIDDLVRSSLVAPSNPFDAVKGVSDTTYRF